MIEEEEKTYLASQALNVSSPTRENALLNSSNSLSTHARNEIIETMLRSSKHKGSYENLLKSEAEQIYQIQKRKDSLAKVNLIESNVDELYNWHNLAHNYYPISHYIGITKSNLMKTLSIANKKQSDNFKFPIALIDAPPERVAMFFPSTATSKTHYNATRPRSVYVRPEKGDVFYLDQYFSDCYKEDFKDFVKRSPLLQPKRRCESAKLKRTIKSLHKQDKKMERMFNDKYSKINKLRAGTVNVSKAFLRLAITKGNAKPLINDIFHQMYPGSPEILTPPSEKVYPKTDKPLGNDYGDVDYTVNMRQMHSNEIKEMREQNSHVPFSTINEVENEVTNDCDHAFEIGKLKTYDINDPDLKIFKKIEQREERIEEIPEEVTEKLPEKTDNTTTLPPSTKKFSRPQTSTKPKSQIRKNMFNKCLSSKSLMNQYKTKKKNSMMLKSSSTNYLFMNYKSSVNKFKKSNVSSISNDVQNNTNDTISTNYDFIPVKCMPIKRSSKVANVTYDKINSKIKSRQRVRSSSQARGGTSDSFKANINPSERELRNSLNSSSSNFNRQLDKVLLSERNSSSVKGVNFIYFNNFIQTLEPNDFSFVNKERTGILPFNYFSRPTSRTKYSRRILSGKAKERQVSLSRSTIEEKRIKSSKKI